MSEQTPYELLCEDLFRAKCVCDPFEFQKRQQNLLYTLAEYLILRDKPPEEKEEYGNTSS